MSVIVHPYGGSSDLDRVAHEHAVALASVSGSKLISVHADTGELAMAPGRASDLLRRWGKDPGSVEHELRIHEAGPDPVETVLELLRSIEADLVVMGTAQHSGALRAILESRAEAIAAALEVPALIIPREARGFVGPGGAVTLRRVLVPIGDEVVAAAEIERTSWFVDVAGAPEVEATLLHVARDGSGPPAPEPPAHPRITWSVRQRAGRIEQTIGEAAEDADLIVMASRGHDSLADWIFGSHTERVLRRLDCPLLALPAPGA